MAKRKRLATGEPRETVRGSDSTFLRSAELLGRMIGSLQRRLRAAAARMAPEASSLQSSRKTLESRQQHRRIVTTTPTHKASSASGQSAKSSRPK
ncbi:MAG TPA: hypothetical protein VFV95_00030 [Vicinamibacterales bacterium]|nr:hypothetical protein [Vicinamibacterales bacterium]